MKLKITRVDKSLPLPEYATSGSVCFDLYSRVNIEIKPQQLVLIPTNLIVQVPEGYMLLIASRSSTPVKKGLLIPNGIGVIDNDFHGPNDEILFVAYNFTKKEVFIEKGVRVAQACLVSVAKAVLIEKEKMKSRNRGGIGSTG